MHNPQKTTKKMEGRQSIAYSFGRVFALAAALCAASASALTLNDGLAVYLPFNNSLTENAVAGSPVTPEASTATPPALVNNGMIGKCLDIPSGAYVKLTGSDSATLANNSLGFEDSNKSFTAIIWANHGALDNDPVIFANKNWGGTAKGALLCAKTVSNKPTVQFNAANGSARIDKTASDTQFTGEGAGKWTFYAMVGKSGSFTMYQGKSDGTFTSKNKSLSSFDMDTGYPFVLGQQGDCNYNRIFTGQLDDFALWNRALSSDDIRRIYECGRAGMELGDILKIDANDEPTMEVAASDNDSATLSFGGRRGSAHTLFVAYGADDAGKDKFAWSGFMPIAEIAPDTAEYTYTFPDLFKAASTRYRFFLMQTNNLPYVKEVTYAHSDGTAYIDSGIAPRRHLIADFDMQFTGDNTEWGTGKTSSQTAIYENIFGAFCGTDKRGNYGICRYRKAGDSNNNMLDRECNGYANAPNNVKAYQFTGTVVNNTDYHVVFSVTNLIVNGTAYGSGITAADFIEGGYGIALYRNMKNGAIYDDTMIGYFKSFSLYTPQQMARDFKPVVDAEGTVGMFDAVTGEFYASVGSPLTAGEDCDAARIGWVRAVSDAGLVVADTAPNTALYTGAGTDPGNLSDSANWTCWNSYGGLIENAAPTDVTAVTVRGETAFTVSSGMMPAYRSITFDNVVLANGAAWRGLDFAKVTPDSVVDLHGQTLLLEGPDGNVTTSFTITDASADPEHPGELHIEVADGASFVNSAIAIAGNLKVVKEGAGIFTAAKTEQSYTGGTDVAAGTVRLGAEVTSCLGTGTVTVGSGTTFDLYGKDASACTMVLAGGTITSFQGDSTLPLHLTQTADSRITFANVAGTHDIKATGSEWNLGGFALTLRLDGNDPDFYIASKTGTTSATTTISNGTLKVEVPATAVNGSGAAYYAWVHIANLNGKDGLSLDLEKSSLRMEPASGNSSVFDFTAMPAQGDVKSTKTMEIYGTYLPASRYGFNMTMMDGSTIDLSGQTGSWNSKFANTKDYSDKNTKVSFAENATVTVNLEGRSDLEELAESDAPYVITWPEAPSGTVKFVLDEATASARYKVRAEAEGLKISRAGGTVIMVR